MTKFGLFVVLNRAILSLAILSLVWVLSAVTVSFAQSSADSDGQVNARADTSVIARQLGSRDPLVRQRAAEDLATLTAVDQKKLIEGYRLQEKDRKVRLALDWALYRIGKAEALYPILRELDTSRHDQAVGYLSQLASPSLLHSFLQREDNQPNVTVGILEALARIGDSESLELIKPFRDSFYPGVAGAAERATDQIEQRLAKDKNPQPTRPRTVSTAEKPLPLSLIHI